MSIDSDMDGRAMNVDMSRVSIGSGSSNVFFSNDQGTLSVRNLEVTGLLATSLLSTASGGVSFLQDSSITSSNIVSVTSTVNGGQQTVTGSSVSGMTGLGTAFSADGSSTRLTLSDVDVVENTIASQQWVGISGLGGADVNANRVNITGNDGIIFGLQTSSGAQAAFSQSTFSRNVAPGAVTSSAVFAVNGTATIERSIFDNNQGFTVSLIVRYFSVVIILTLCRALHFLFSGVKSISANPVCRIQHRSLRSSKIACQSFGEMPRVILLTVTIRHNALVLVIDCFRKTLELSALLEGNQMIASERVPR